MNKQPNAYGNITQKIYVYICTNRLKKEKIVKESKISKPFASIL